MLTTDTVASPCPLANEDYLHKTVVLSFVFRVAVAWSSARIGGNLLASGDKLFREISGPGGGRLGVLRRRRLNTSFTLE